MSLVPVAAEKNIKNVVVHTRLDSVKHHDFFSDNFTVILQILTSVRR